jgi:hypothetical protein
VITLEFYREPTTTPNRYNQDGSVIAERSVVLTLASCAICGWTSEESALSSLFLVEHAIKHRETCGPEIPTRANATAEAP